MPYFLQVKLRFTTRLLTVLLALTAPFFVPVSLGATPRVTCAVVRVDPARETKRKVRRVRAVAQRQEWAAIPASDVFARHVGLDHSLFQRPPPDSL